MAEDKANLGRNANDKKQDAGRRTEDRRGATPQATHSLRTALDLFDRRSSAIEFYGLRIPDKNIEGNFLVVQNDGTFHSFSTEDLVDEEQTGGNFVRVWIRVGARAWRSSSISIGGAGEQRFETLVGMEDIEPPPMEDVPGMPTPADESDGQQLLATLAVQKTIAGAAAAYNGKCVGGDRYKNNCAHFLSDAFIRAGFDEIRNPNNPHGCIEARCGTSAKRVIRARNMWCWFQSRATTMTRTLQRNTGMWAVFQIDGYWGGHVVIIDTDKWKYYGTACHWNWNQYAYKW